MRSYEMMVLVDAALEDHKAEIDGVEELIKGIGGEIVKTDVWGKRRLAYSIDKHTEGYYAVLNFKLEPDSVKEMERLLGLRSTVLRHMVVNLDEK